MRPVTGLDLARMFGLGFVVPSAVTVAGLITYLLIHSIAVAILGAGIGLALIVFVVWDFRRRGWTLRDFGFIPLGRRGWHLVWQAPVLLLVSLLLAAAIGAAVGVEPTSDQQNGLQELVPDSYMLLGFVVLSFIVVIAGPIWEEIVFRRFLMGWLDKRLNIPAISIGVSALVFALVHLAPPVMIWTFLLGIWCAILVRWHGSLWASVIFHSFNNLLVTIGMGVAMFA